MFYPRGNVDCQKVKWHQTDMQIPKFQIFDIISDFCDDQCVWKALTWKQIIICRVHIMWHGGKSVSGCLPLPCSHHGGPNKGWGLGAWGSWRILGLLQTNSWDLWGVWGRNSHCCVKISTKEWNDYLHKKRESNDVCTNQNFHSILIFVPYDWGGSFKIQKYCSSLYAFRALFKSELGKLQHCKKRKEKKAKRKTEHQEEDQLWPCCSPSLEKTLNVIEMLNYIILTWNKSIYHHLHIMVSPIAKVTSGMSSVDIFTHQGHISQLVS